MIFDHFTINASRCNYFYKLSLLSNQSTERDFLSRAIIISCHSHTKGSLALYFSRSVGEKQNTSFILRGGISLFELERKVYTKREKLFNARGEQVVPVMLDKMRRLSGVASYLWNECKVCSELKPKIKLPFFFS